MRLTISKSTAKGIIEAPPSKSLAHRYIICAGLSEGKSVVSNISLSEDIRATIDCIRALGREVTVEGDKVTVHAGKIAYGDRIVFPCRESGSTMRFFMGIAMALDTESVFEGSETLRNRPMSVYEDIAAKEGISFVKEASCIRLKGSLSAGEYAVKGNISSQFITGLLYGLSLIDGKSLIKIEPPIESRSYIELTLQALRTFGVKAAWLDDDSLEIEGGASYKACDVRVEGDFSNAAFLDAFNVLGGDVRVEGLNDDSSQGDKVYREIYKGYEAGVVSADISDCPDLGPVLFALAAASKGGSFTGTKRLKIKESDRGTVMCEELSKFGVDTYMEDNLIIIGGGKLKRPAVALDGHNDHRIVMSLVLLLTLTGGEIEGAEAVRKSYPDFFEDIKKLGIEVI